MRDVHGRYRDLKEIADNGPEWAAGCDRCTFGVASAPPLTGAASILLERLVQAIDKQLVFCDCTAGERYRANLLNHRQKLIEEARRDSRMGASVAKLTHPDIEMARHKIEEALLNTPAPTVHMEAVA